MLITDTDINTKAFAPCRLSGNAKNMTANRRIEETRFLNAADLDKTSQDFMLKPSVREATFQVTRAENSTRPKAVRSRNTETKFPLDAAARGSAEMDSLLEAHGVSASSFNCPIELQPNDEPVTSPPAPPSALPLPPPATTSARVVTDSACGRDDTKANVIERSDMDADCLPTDDNKRVDATHKTSERVTGLRDVSIEVIALTLLLFSIESETLTRYNTG